MMARAFTDVGIEREMVWEGGEGWLGKRGVQG